MLHTGVCAYTVLLILRGSEFLPALLSVCLSIVSRVFISVESAAFHDPISKCEFSPFKEGECGVFFGSFESQEERRFACDT